MSLPLILHKKSNFLHRLQFRSLQILTGIIISHLKAPPDAVKMIRRSAPSGKPWIHWRKEIPFRFAIINRNSNWEAQWWKYGIKENMHSGITNAYTELRQVTDVTKHLNVHNFLIHLSIIIKILTYLKYCRMFWISRKNFYFMLVSKRKDKGTSSNQGLFIG